MWMMDWSSRLVGVWFPAGINGRISNSVSSRMYGSEDSKTRRSKGVKDWGSQDSVWFHDKIPTYIGVAGDSSKSGCVHIYIYICTNG